MAPRKNYYGTKRGKSDVFDESEESVPPAPSFSPPVGQEKPGSFADEVRNFLREKDREGSERLRYLLERFCEEDPKAAFQSLAAYAFGKPAERLDVSATVAGVPEKFIELFRERAREL